MNQRQKPKKRRGATVATVLCFVAAIAITGTYTFKDYREKQREDELAEAEELRKDAKEKEDSEEASGEAEKFVIHEEKKTDETAEQPNNETGKEQEGTDTAATENTGTGAADSQQTAAQPSVAHFNGSSMLLWPVDGNILLSYSMDKTVYFQTLNQYKYNPALVIAGAEGDQVICGAPGIVKSIDVTAQTGTTVNVDIGNGYELFYGQLKEVPVKVGDFVEAKTVLGYVSQPTKYYSVEGCNVYFEMRKDGQPVNPMEYLVE